MRIKEPIKSFPRLSAKKTKSAQQISETLAPTVETSKSVQTQETPFRATKIFRHGHMGEDDIQALEKQAEHGLRGTHIYDSICKIFINGTIS